MQVYVVIQTPKVQYRVCDDLCWGSLINRPFNLLAIIENKLLIWSTVDIFVIYVFLFAIH